jgi:hypothetical protein
MERLYSSNSCTQCQLLDDTLARIVTLIDKQRKNIDCEQLSLLLEDFKRSSESIINWKRHQLRSVHQDLARDYILEELDDSNVYLVIDWAMKWVEAKYREKQSEWYGKKGLPWHLTSAIRRQRTDATLSKADPVKKFEHRTLCHVFDQCKQDALSVVSILEDVLKRLKANDHQLRFAYLRSDNGACYHSAITTTAAQELLQRTGVLIKRIDFSEPQAGKGPCDRRAAVIKGEVRRHIDEKHNCTNSVEFVQASKSTQHLSVFASQLPLAGKSGSSKDTAKKPSKTSWSGISSIFNMQYESTLASERPRPSTSGVGVKVCDSFRNVV